MTAHAPCPHCGAEASKPSPVAGEPNCTESWIIHADRCPGPARQPSGAELLTGFAVFEPARFAAMPDPANPLGLPYGPKPAKPSTNGATP